MRTPKSCGFNDVVWSKNWWKCSVCQKDMPLDYETGLDKKHLKELLLRKPEENKYNHPEIDMNPLVVAELLEKDYYSYEDTTNIDLAAELLRTLHAENEFYKIDHKKNEKALKFLHNEIESMDKQKLKLIAENEALKKKIKEDMEYFIKWGYKEK